MPASNSTHPASLIQLKSGQLKKALASLNKALAETKTEFTRDAAIQRFEYSFELFWKVVKIFLNEKGIFTYSPKDCMRELRNEKILKDEEVELAIKMANDRNLSVHTYNEKLANELYSRLKIYLKLMKKVSEKIS
ncbi:MAG: HI0074 family nucleotidyltransferase substrate-binding subunit [Patescibacteria group bacterium]